MSNFKKAAATATAALVLAAASQAKAAIEIAGGNSDFSQGLNGWSFRNWGVQGVDGVPAAFTGCASTGAVVLGDINECYLETTISGLQPGVVTTLSYQLETGGKTPNLFNSYINGALEQSTSNSVSGFTTYSFTFTPTAAEVTYRANAENGPGIDAVTNFNATQPTAPSIPEPATWGLMIAGLGLVGAKLRGDRAAKAALNNG